MNHGRLLAAGVLIGGSWYLLTRSGALAGTGAGLDDLGLVAHEPTPAELARAQAVRQPAAGNAPIVQNPSFVQQGGLSAIAAAGASALPLLGVGGVALGITTAGIGLAVAFVSYALLKQRASMHTNDVRDQWESQFVPLAASLGIPPLTADETRGSAPGTVEMAQVIYLFDHDDNHTLWKSVQQTQDERTFRYAAGRVDAFLTANGVPVQDVA